MTDEIRRRKTTDPELDAVNVIAQALTPLDYETCTRVIRWAEDRFIEQAKRDMKEMAWVSVKEQVDAYKKYAADLGLDDRKLAHAIAHVRQLKKLAPVGTDPDPEDTVKVAVENLG